MRPHCAHLLRCITVLALIALPATPGAAASDRHSLDDLYRIALERAETIALSAEEVKIAEGTRDQARSVLIPKIDAVGTYRYYSDEKSVGGNLLQPQWRSSYGLQASQQLTLNGRELTALRIAKTDIVRNRETLAATEEAYLFSVAQGYFAMAQAQRQLGIAGANVTRLETQKNAVEARLRIGEVTKTDLFRIQAELAKANTGRIRAQNILDLSTAALARVVGLTGSIQIDADNPEVPTTLDDSLADRIALALTQRAELKSLTLAKTIAEDQVKYTRGEYWPTVGVEGAWMRMDQDPDSPYDESAYVGVSLAVPLYDGGLRRAGVDKAKAEARKAHLAKNDLERQIRVDVQQAWLDRQSQQSTLESLASQLTFAKQNFSAVQRLYANGLANSVDVTDANTVLVTAELELNNAMFDLILGDIRLDRTTGILREQVLARIGQTAETRHTMPK